MVADYDKEPDPSTNQGKVEKVLDDQLVRVLWKDGTTSDRPANKLAKITTSRYTPDPAERKKVWDEILQMSDEEMDAEIGNRTAPTAVEAELMLVSRFAVAKIPAQCQRIFLFFTPTGHWSAFALK